MTASGFQMSVFPAVCVGEPGQCRSQKTWVSWAVLCSARAESSGLLWHKPRCSPEKAVVVKDNDTFLWLQQARVTAGSSLSIVFLHRLENISLVFLFKFLCLVSFALKTTASFYYYPIWMNVLENCSMKLKRVFIFFLRRSETQYMSEY